MGLSDKLRAGVSIGKFGLGLKSVLHWCEAFVYVAKHRDSDEVEGDILNPWSGEPSAGHSFHTEWDDFGRVDIEQVSAHIAELVAGWPQWFCVWIPLRQRRQLGDINPVQAVFPGDTAEALDVLNGPTLGQDLANSLPQHGWRSRS